MTYKTTAARVHRFHEMVALYLRPQDVQPETAYLSAPLAREIGEALIRFADDIETVKFTDSDIGSMECGDAR